MSDRRTSSETTDPVLFAERMLDSYREELREWLFRHKASEYCGEALLNFLNGECEHLWGENDHPRVCDLCGGHRT